MNPKRAKQPRKPEHRHTTITVRYALGEEFRIRRLERGMECDEYVRHLLDLDKQRTTTAPPTTGP